MLKKNVISGDTNVTKKEAEMILKYKDLITETQHMWYIKAKVIPVTTGAMKSSLSITRIYLSNITGKHEIEERQTTDAVGTAHTHTAEITDVKAQNIHLGKQQYMLHES